MASWAEVQVVVSGDGGQDWLRSAEGGFDFCPHILGLVDKENTSEKNGYLLSPQLPSPFTPGLRLSPREQLSPGDACGGFHLDPWWSEESWLPCLSVQKGCGARTERKLSLALHEALLKPAVVLPRAQAVPKAHTGKAGPGLIASSASLGQRPGNK